MSQNTMFSVGEPPARDSLSPDEEKEWMTRVLNWRGTSLDLLRSIARAGFFGRTSLACFQAGQMKRRMEMQTGDDSAINGMKPTILSDSPVRLQNSGMVWRGEFLTLATSTWRNGANVCLLSAILEIGDLPPRYYLTAKACRGILRRAKKRGKALPPMLKKALENVASASSEPRSESPTTEPTTTKTKPGR